MHAAVRVGLVAALTAVIGVGVYTGSGDGYATPHGCTQPWDGVRDPLGAAARTFGLRAATEVVDDFGGPAGAPPDPDVWTVIDGAGWDRGTQTYTPDNAVLDGDGHLMLRAVRTGGGYASGRVETRRRASFGYGTLIARIKMPAGQGLWPALWLMGADEGSNPWPAAGEVDVVEMVSDPRTAYSSLHGPIQGVADFLQKQFVNHGPDLSAGFHDYWVIHAEDKITVGVDKTVWGVFTPDGLPPGAQWVYNKPFCLILNLAVGGDWAGPPDASTPFPAAMLVDWVHWQPA